MKCGWRVTPRPCSGEGLWTGWPSLRTAPSSAAGKRSQCSPIYRESRALRSTEQSVGFVEKQNRVRTLGGSEDALEILLGFANVLYSLFLRGRSYRALARVRWRRFPPSLSSPYRTA